MYIIYVDDERPALENFRLTVASIRGIRGLELFQSGYEALEWARLHVVDVAFLDMDMPVLHGLQLARLLKEVNPQIQIVFVTAYRQFAMDAWEVEASGYLTKPYATSDIERALIRCGHSGTTQKVEINTIPSLEVLIGGKPLHIPGRKPRELFALLVDHGDRGITTGEGIAYLWPERPSDAVTQSLFRMTYKRLMETLEKEGVGDIIVSQKKRRFLRTDRVDCDLYRILRGDRMTARKYDGQYMREYSWAEERNGQISRFLHR
jgi:two-component SAPR family response regulator